MSATYCSLDPHNDNRTHASRYIARKNTPRQSSTLPTIPNPPLTPTPIPFRSFISRTPDSPFPPAADRYILYLHYGCPWAHRTNILRHLKGLTAIIPLVVLDPTKNPSGGGWQFTGELDTDPQDPLYGFSSIRELYHKADRGYTGPFSVPVLWDKQRETIVNNESSEIVRMLTTAFDSLLSPGLREENAPGGGLYPLALRTEIDELNAWIHADISSCVYRIGSASTQEDYDTNISTLFSALHRVEERLARPGNGPFLCGSWITEADVRLFTSVVRFDVAYYTMLRCSRKMVRYDYPRLHEWVRRLYWGERAFRETTKFEHIRKLYSGWVQHGITPASPMPYILPLGEEMEEGPRAG